MSYAHQEEFRSVSQYFYIISFTSIGSLCSLMVMKLLLEIVIARTDLLICRIYYHA